MERDAGEEEPPHEVVETLLKRLSNVWIRSPSGGHQGVTCDTTFLCFLLFSHPGRLHDDTPRGDICRGRRASCPDILGFLAGRTDARVWRGRSGAPLLLVCSPRRKAPGPWLGPDVGIGNTRNSLPDAISVQELQERFRALRMPKVNGHQLLCSPHHFDDASTQKDVPGESCSRIP